MLAIVPARGGSKRLPGKNIRDLAGKPLIFHTLDAFLGHSEIDRVVFTTDSGEYASLVTAFYGDTVDVQIRPQEFAKDTTKVVFEVERLLRQYEITASDFFLVGLPTAPLRNADHVAQLLEEFLGDGSARFSCCEYNFPIQFGFELDNKKDWTPFIAESPMVTGNTRSQDLQKLYRPNGAIYLQNTGTFLESMSFYTKAKGFVMDQRSSIDIDSAEDFELAEFLMGASNV